MLNNRKTMAVVAIILLAIPLVLFYFNTSIVIHVLLCVWVAAVLAGYGYIAHRQHERKERRLIESFQRTATATLGHHRHDWMNDLQLLYGYIQLGKHDKLLDCLDRIRERMTGESKISKLGIPSLVFYLQSFRVMNNSVQLEVEIADNLELGNLLTPDAAERLAGAVMETIRAYQFAGRSAWGEIIELKLSFYQENNEIIIRFERKGGSWNEEMLNENIDKAVRGKQIDTSYVSVIPGCFEMRMPSSNLNEVNSCL